MGRINAFRVIERLERMNIIGGQNTENVNNNVLNSFAVNRFSMGNVLVNAKKNW